jgi:hypothetical protein
MDVRMEIVKVRVCTHQGMVCIQEELLSLNRFYDSTIFLHRNCHRPNVCFKSVGMGSRCVKTLRKLSNVRFRFAAIKRLSVIRKARWSRLRLQSLEPSLFPQRDDVRQAVDRRYRLPNLYHNMMKNMLYPPNSMGDRYAGRRHRKRLLTSIEQIMSYCNGFAGYWTVDLVVKCIREVMFYVLKKNTFNI